MPALQATKSAESSSPDSSHRRHRAATSPVHLLALALMLGIAVGVACVALHKTTRPLLSTSFPHNGLITNEFAYEHPLSPQAALSPVWEVTSGSLFGRDGAGWTGPPDGIAPGPTSAAHNDSAVF